MNLQLLIPHCSCQQCQTCCSKVKTIFINFTQPSSYLSTDLPLSKYLATVTLKVALSTRFSRIINSIVTHLSVCPSHVFYTPSFALNLYTFLCYLLLFCPAKLLYFSFAYLLELSFKFFFLTSLLYSCTLNHQFKLQKVLCICFKTKVLTTLMYVLAHTFSIILHIAIAAYSLKFHSLVFDIHVHIHSHVTLIQLYTQCEIHQSLAPLLRNYFQSQLELFKYDSCCFLM